MSATTSSIITHETPSQTALSVPSYVGQSILPPNNTQSGRSGGRGGGCHRTYRGGGRNRRGHGGRGSVIPTAIEDI